MNAALMEEMKQFLQREDNQSLVGSPASLEEIAAAERELQVAFHPDYVQFIATFGGAYAGLAVHAFVNGSSIGRETVVELTQSFREQYRDLPFAEALQRGYVISLDGSGDPIFVDADGHVHILYHDTGESRQLAESFEQLIADNFVAW